MKYKVLFVADRENIETYAELVLKDVDLVYSPFRSSPEKIPYCDSDLMILDCGLHFERGIELLKEFKKNCPELLVIFLTANGTEQIAVDAFRSGAREYFRKPVNLFELQSTIENFLSLIGRSMEKRFRLERPEIGKKERAFHNTTTEKPVNLLRAVRYMEENLSQSISLQDLAGESKLSACHFCREFNKHFGTSPMSYLTSMRMERAKELLMRDDLNISMMAYELGYDSPGTLIRNFKKSTGLTPRDYREHIRNNGKD